MDGNCRDLTLEEAMRDPLIAAVMKADGVDPLTLEADLRQTALAIEWQRIEPAPAAESCAPWC
jgi:hypothetical protein